MMKLAAWKYFSVIMALVLVLGTGVTALVPAVPATAAAPAHHSSHATDNGTRKSDRGPSENRTHHFPGFSQYSSPAHGYTAGDTLEHGAPSYVDNQAGNDDYSGADWAHAFKTIQHAVENVTLDNTIYVRGQVNSSGFPAVPYN